MLRWLREKLTKRTIIMTRSQLRRVTLEEDAPSERFVLSIALMIVFFAGLVALEIAHLLVTGEWNDVVFNGVMLIVGSLVGALFGWRES